MTVSNSLVLPSFKHFDQNCLSYQAFFYNKAHTSSQNIQYCCQYLTANMVELIIKTLKQVSSVWRPLIFFLVQMLECASDVFVNGKWEKLTRLIHMHNNAICTVQSLRQSMHTRISCLIKIALQNVHTQVVCLDTNVAKSYC